MRKCIMEGIKKYKLIFPGNTLIAAVSGGPDSIAMLHVIRQLTADWRVSIHVAHFNHMFRGKEAEEEASFVAATAGQMGLGCTVEAFDVPSYLKKTGLSPEEGARERRYQFLHRVARDRKADFIMTAHHANDQAETVLLHLLRGTGPEGLAAIAPREGNLIRPMLSVTKEAIMAYCREHHLAYRLDPTNNEGVYTRNKIRLDLLPYLERFNPRIVQSLVRTADICRWENDFFSEITRWAMENIDIITDDMQVSVDRSRLDLFHPAVQRRLIRQVLDDYTGVQGFLSFDHTEALMDLKSGKEVCLPGSLYGRQEGGRLIVGREKASRNQQHFFPPVPLQVPGVTRIPDLGLEVRVEIVNWPDCRFSKEKYAQAFHSRILDQPLFLRNRCPGDRFRPKGMKGRKKLKDFFIDKKINWAIRDQIPLILAGKEIIWVVGHRTGEDTGVGAEDDKAVVVIVKSYLEHK